MVIRGSCGSCVWENQFGDCSRLASGLQCSDWQCDHHGDGCPECRIRYVCPYSPCKLEVYHVSRNRRV